MLEYLRGGIESQLATGSDDWFGENFEPPKFSQGEAEIDFFSDEKRFVEAADCFEMVSRCEKERTGSEVQRKINRAEKPDGNPRPPWNWVPNGHARATAGETTLKRVNRAAYVFGINVSIGIDKKQNVAPRRASARISRGRDLSTADRDYFRAVIPRDASGLIR